MVEGVHFRLDGRRTAGDAGHRALAAALSDLAAMGVGAGAGAAARAGGVSEVADRVAGDVGHEGRRREGRVLAAAGARAVTAGSAGVAAQLGAGASELAATGGEDFELLACIPPDARA